MVFYIGINLFVFLKIEPAAVAYGVLNFQYMPLAVCFQLLFYHNSALQKLISFLRLIIV